jgi:NADPH-dependent ferric siderophore reductase
MKVADNPAPRPARRDVTVASVMAPTPRLRRIVLEGPDLADIRSDRFDDHVKLLVPGTDVRRSYTIRHVDAQARQLTLDCVLHGHGPAAQWAASVRAGDRVTVFGPKPRHEPVAFAETRILFGDTTALPAMARCLETADRHSGRVHVYVALDDAGERQRDLKPLRPGDTLAWLDPDGMDDLGWVRLRHAARRHDWSAADITAWIATETSVARRLRAELIEEEALSRTQIKAAGYWRAGEVDGGMRL